MKRISNRIGKVKHLALFPETPADEREIELCIKLATCIHPGTITEICDLGMYRLAPVSLTHESEVSRLDLYML
jgi:hypothetical protein